MYIPKVHRNTDDAEIKAFIQRHGFAILINQTNGKLWGTHIPLQLADGNKLHGHISKGNPQWKNFANGEEVLAIFSGPHAYISSSWYDHENVPTWNYIAVHVYGTIRVIEGEELYASLKHLVDKYEQHSEHPVSMEKMDPEYVQKHLNALVGFEISITQIEAAYKLSQNRDRKNHVAIVEQLEKRNDPESCLVAEAMKLKTPH
jgi:transcriptional regulator